MRIGHPPFFFPFLFFLLLLPRLDLRGEVFIVRPLHSGSISAPLLLACPCSPTDERGAAQARSQYSRLAPPFPPLPARFARWRLRKRTASGKLGGQKMSVFFPPPLSSTRWKRHADDLIIWETEWRGALFFFSFFFFFLLPRQEGDQRRRSLLPPSFSLSIACRLFSG